MGMTTIEKKTKITIYLNTHLKLSKYLTERATLSNWEITCLQIKMLALHINGYTYGIFSGGGKNALRIHVVI